MQGNARAKTDGGATWTNAFTGLSSQAIAEVIVDPSDAATIVVATRRGLARTTDAGATWSFPAATSGLFTKTLATAPGGWMYSSVSGVCCEGDVVMHSSDHGLTWSAHSTPGSRPADSGSHAEIYHLAVDPRPADGVDIVYAATLHGLFKSADSGLTWTRLTPASVQVTFVAVRPGTPSLLVYSLGNSLDNTNFLSTDDGLTATALPFTGRLAAVAFDPSSVDTIYAAVQPLTFLCAPVGGLFKSIDRGASWTDAGTGLPPRAGCGTARYWVSGLAIDAANPSRLFVALTGGLGFRPFGIYGSTDAAATWASMAAPSTDLFKSLRFAGSTLLAATHGGSLFALDPSCPTVASPAVAGVSAAGGPVAVTIDTSTSCGWSAASDAGFVTVSGASSTGDGTVSLLVAPNAGAPRTATVTIGGATVLVNQSAPDLVLVAGAALRFTATNSGAAFTSRTAAQSVRIMQRGPGNIPWTVQADQPWVTVSAASGAGTATVNIGVAHTFGMPMAETLHAVVTITPSGMAQSPLTIPVTLTVVPQGSTLGPIGVFDTPANNASGLTGSVPVTGWALDDVDVTRVRILRDPVAPEPPGVLIYIGDAVLVDGARPDVAGAFPSVPRNTRGGWGYLLLTNFLPGAGNGTFTLHAIADDADGHSTDLGTKIISLDNQNATTPFGAIDTPGQGATVCGAIVNFGWALTQVPKDIPADSSTITVFIDGVAVGQPGNRASRSDIASLFPGYDTSHAVGAFLLDTTQYSNGVHTIAWVVTDSAGQAGGIGSRFFTIANPCGASVATVAVHASATRALVDRAPIDPSPIFPPGRSHRVGAQVAIDAPSAQSGVHLVDRAFVIAGWAADFDSGVDRGVDAVHVWAYPVNARNERERPWFLGPAAYGGARPDVAAVFGERFLNTGYGMDARLEPGVYDLAVLAFSTVQGAFAPAQVVRVVVK